MSRLPFVLLIMCLGVYAPAMAQSSSTAEKTEEEDQYLKNELTSVNSDYAEARPLISEDGNTLYFSRRYHKENQHGEKDIQDVWVSYRDTLTDSWSEPLNLGASINNRKGNAIASLSPDGGEGIFFNTYRRTKRMPLVRSRQQGSSSNWTKPKALEIENYINISDYADFFLAYKQQVLLLAIEGDSVVGEQDLYVAFPDGKGGWKEPKNLGSVINTKKSDFAPFMGADGRSLFFCSYGHKSFGGSDIFMSVRLDDSWTNWSEPVNLGTAINTPIEETYFSITSDFKYLYYTSQHPHEKNRNIVRVELPEDFTAINGPVLVQLDSAAMAKIMLSGNYSIHPQGKSKHISGIAFYTEPAEKTDAPGVDAQKEAAEEDVLASAIVALHDSVLAEINNEAALAGSQPAVKPSLGLENVPTGLRNDFVSAEPTAVLSPAAADMLAYLEKKLIDLDLEVRIQENRLEFKVAQNLMYEFNSVFVSTDYIPRLTQMARVLQEKPELELKLAGYTDNIGSASVNKRVAMKRAQNLVHFFEERGIDPARIEILAGGQEDPLADNNTEEGRAKNRRVETSLKFQE